MLKKSAFVILFVASISHLYSQSNMFNEVTPLPQGRQMHGSVVLGDYLYIIGGETKKENYTSSIEFAKINQDGTIGNFKKTTPLPKKAAYIDNCTIALNDILYIATGWNGITSKSYNTIMWTRPQPNGELEPWRISTPFPGDGVDCSAAVATSGYIHIIGGLGEKGIVKNAVWSAKIAADGSIEGWEAGPPLPETIWYHNAGVSHGKVWVWGGLTKNDSTALCQNSYFAPILSNGKLGPWQTTNAQLPQKFYSASCTVSSNFLISFSARYGAKNISSDIWYTSVDASGLLANWEKIQNAAIKSNIYMAIATDYRRGNVYISGGRNSVNKDSYNNNVYFIKLTKSEQANANYDIASTYDSSKQNTSAGNYSYVSQNQQTAGKYPGFVTYAQAQQQLSTKKLPMLLYFYSDKAKKCAEQSQILANFSNAQYGDKIVFAEVETVMFPQASQQHGILKVPTWVMYDASGSEKFRHTGVLNLNAINDGISKVIQ